MQLAEDLSRVDEVVCGDAAHGRVEGAAGVRQRRRRVEVVHDPLGKRAIGPKLLRIHSEPGHAAQRQGVLLWQMRCPRGAQVEQVALCRQRAGIVRPQCRTARVVDVRRPARLLIKDPIVSVRAPEIGRSVKPRRRELARLDSSPLRNNRAERARLRTPSPLQVVCKHLAVLEGEAACREPRQESGSAHVELPVAILQLAATQRGVALCRQRSLSQHALEVTFERLINRPVVSTQLRCHLIVHSLCWLLVCRHCTWERSRYFSKLSRPR
eukprot:7387561-Prymnesium_polylepis.1